MSAGIISSSPTYCNYDIYCNEEIKVVRKNIRFFFFFSVGNEKKMSMFTICTSLPSCFSALLLFHKCSSVLGVHRIKHEIILSIATKNIANFESENFPSLP